MKISNNFLRYLNCHKHCNRETYLFANGLNSDEIELARNVKIAKIRNMVSEVRLEIHRMRSFVRLSPLGKFILYGYMRPKHDVGNIVANIFAHRYPQNMIVVGNNYQSWISLYAKGNLSCIRNGPLSCVIADLKHLKNLHEEEGSVDKLWKTYYGSQYRPERRNLKYFHNNMTLSSIKSARLGVESNTNGETLDRYVVLNDNK